MAKLYQKYEHPSVWSRNKAWPFLIVLLLMYEINQVACAQEMSLNDHRDAGKANNPALQEYRNDAQVANLENEKVISDYRYPAVQADFNWMEAPVLNGLGYDEAITNGAWYSALAGMSMPLFTKALSQPELEKNNLQAGKSKWQGKMGWKELSLQITNLYALCFADHQNLDNLKDQLNVITDQHRLARKLAEQGIVRASATTGKN